MKSLATALALIALLPTQPSNAQTAIISTDRGWYREDGFTIAFNTNYEAGIQTASDPTPRLRSFFVFDLSTFSTGTIAGLTLQAFTSGYVSPDPTETFTLFDYSGSISDLTAGVNSVSDYNDLGSGTVFGTATVSAANNNTSVTITLNSSAITAANQAAGGLFAIGGDLTTATGSSDQRIFLDSQTYPSNAVQLSVTIVPEPSATLLGALGVLGILLRRKRKAPMA